MAKPPIQIIGAGIGGLTLARCLLHHGIPAVVYERMSMAARHSYGITLHASSYKPLLDILGLDEGTFRRRIAVDKSVGGSGTVHSSSILNPTKVISTSFRAHRGKLEKLLQEGVDIRWEHPVEKCEETPEGTTLSIQNGQKLWGPGIVAADGVHSIIRKSLLSNAGFSVLPYVTFNGRRRVDRTLFDTIYSPTMKGSNVLESKQGNTMLSISINDIKGEVVDIGWVYSRPALDSKDSLHKPRRSVSGATDIPDEFFTEVGYLNQLPQPFKEVFDVEKLKNDRLLHWLMRTISSSHQELRESANKGIYFIGDSVHAEPILGGQGANNAIQDALELAWCIASPDRSAVTAWHESRYATWKNGVKQSVNVIAEMHSEFLGSHKQPDA